jgi:prefoldin subunit 5
MTSNQELLEMVQALEQKVIELQQWVDVVRSNRSKIQVLESDLDDVDNRSNRLIEKMVTTTMFNNSMEIQEKFGLNDIRGRL